MSDNQIRKKLFLLGILFSISFLVSPVFASETNGIIDTTDKYAWGENIGWINFGCDDCDVQITDTNITGYAWSSQYGWINLNPTTAGLENDGTGILSGNAWSSNLGWIDFAGVTINSGGEFIGYATLQSDNSQINFNCAGIIDSCSEANFKVKTDWRRASMRSSGGGASGSRPNPPATPPITPPVLPPFINPPIFSDIQDNISSIINKASDFLSYLFTGELKTIPDTTLASVPKIAPLPFSSKWNLLPIRAINSFVFAPLPYEVRVLANKFPELDKTLKSVGVERLSDMGKLTGVSLNIPGLANILDRTIKIVGMEKLSDIEQLHGVSLNVPGLSDINEEMIGSVGTGKIALIKGLPVANFSLTAKKNLPAEFVFARANGELVDLNVALSVGEKGEVTQQISSLPGKTMRLVVKPISRARSVTGYFIFKSATPKIVKNEISRSSLSASVLFSMNSFVEQVPTSPLAPLHSNREGRISFSSNLGKVQDGADQRIAENFENKLVLSSFEYTDPDKDGIYTADVTTPLVPGEYEIITIIDYIDSVLGTRQMRMITVIDPEGYVFEKRDGKETRIPSAIVSLYQLNTATKTYELWPSKDYQQDNPQITDVRGTYSFLVPEGTYYFHIEAPGYDSHQGKAFVVSEGSGIHMNIELSSGSKWLNELDWKTILLIVVFLLLVYNLYRNRERDRLLKLLNKNGNRN